MNHQALFFTLLVCDGAGGLTGRLAGRLAFAAAAGLYRRLKILFRYNFYVFFSIDIIHFQILLIAFF